MASEAIFAPKTLLLIFALVLAWYQDSDSLHVCTHGDKCPSAVSSPLRRTWRSDARKPVRILLSILSYRNPSENMWPPRQNLLVLRSPQLSFTVTSGPWHSCGHGSVQTQAKGRRSYFSQNIGLAVAGSARPVPPPLNISLWQGLPALEATSIVAALPSLEDRRNGWNIIS